jgi:hypothetical protein
MSKESKMKSAGGRFKPPRRKGRKEDRDWGKSKVLRNFVL